MRLAGELFEEFVEGPYFSRPKAVELNTNLSPRLPSHKGRSRNSFPAWRNHKLKGDIRSQRKALLAGNEGPAQRQVVDTRMLRALFGHESGFEIYTVASVLASF